MSQFKYKDGRIWLQTRKFEPFKLLLPYGLTGITDPLGNLNAVREPSASQRGATVIVDVIRGEPGLPQFQIDTRLQRTHNYLLGLRNCTSNFQGHLGKCDRPDNYYASAAILHWERSRRGDLTIDRTAIIQGDDAPIQMQAPFVAEIGPLLFDMETEFLSPRTIGDTEDGTAVAFLGSECLENCLSQEDAGENGYVATKVLAGSAGNQAQLWYTEDKGEIWDTVSEYPFASAMAISDVIAAGMKRNHRVIVSNGTTRASDPAQIAYADVTDIGTTDWVQVDVGAVDGQYILDLLFVDWMNVFASTDDGYIYKSVDGGASWTAVYTAGVVDINKMSALSNGVIWAVGNSNLVLLSTDGGESWTELTGPATVAEDALSVHVTPDGTAFVGFNDGTVYGSYDNGIEWHVLAMQGVTPTEVTDIKSFGDSDIFVSVNTADGGKVLRSIDGGASFRLWKLNVPVNDGITRIEMIDANMVWVVGDATGGSTFLTRTHSNIIGI